jgi:hypothetical protein
LMPMLDGRWKGFAEGSKEFGEGKRRKKILRIAEAQKN